MRRWLVATAAAVSLVGLPWLTLDAAQEVTGDTRILAAATYVAFGFGGGGGFVSDVDAGKTADVSQEDRTALTDIRAQFEKWHRYTLTNFPENAELLVAVRVGRRGTAGGRTAVGGRPPGTGLQRTDAGVQSPDDDMLTVYSTTAGGRRSRSMVWQKAIPNGLSGSPAPLFEEFRMAVEAASKKHRP